MHEGKPFEIYDFHSQQNPLRTLEIDQADYLVYYLGDLGASWILEEPGYFDRDYLAEFSAFYAYSSRGYPNLCRRIHYFKGDAWNRQDLLEALCDSTRAEALKQSYLGCTVLRPLPWAPLGRTVVRFYEDRDPLHPRFISPVRKYISHVAGLELCVEGLAWQQQDGAVASCATVGLWTLLHCAGLDLRHAIPTTPEITQAAHRNVPLGSRLFPTPGLEKEQVLEAIKEMGIEPVLLAGDTYGGDRFSKTSFSRNCSYLIRSGFPLLMWADTYDEIDNEDAPHIVCIVGFRASGEREDDDIAYVYIHDDNMGPGVRFKVEVEDTTEPYGSEVEQIVSLEPEPPVPVADHEHLPINPTEGYTKLYPRYLISAVPKELRVSPPAFHESAVRAARDALKDFFEISTDAFESSVYFFETWKYMGEELGRVLSPSPPLLGQVRLQVNEEVRPMGRFVGVVRASSRDTRRLLVDILFDVSDGDMSITPYCIIIFSDEIRKQYGAAVFPI